MSREGGGSGDQAGLLGELNGLGAAASTEFIEEAAGVSLDSVFTDEEAIGDFAIAEAGGDEAEDFEFAGSDAELREAQGVQGEG